MSKHLIVIVYTYTFFIINSIIELSLKLFCIGCDFSLKVATFVN